MLFISSSEVQFLEKLGKKNGPNVINGTSILDYVTPKTKYFVMFNYALVPFPQQKKFGFTRKYPKPKLYNDFKN